MNIINLPQGNFAMYPPDVPVVNLSYSDPTPQKRKHDAEPIKSREDLFRISSYLITQKRYRDNLLFVMGTNFGLRCGDLVKIKVGQVVNFDGYDEDKNPKTSYKQSLTVQEGKTKKLRTVYINKAVCEALDFYFSQRGYMDFDSYLFRSNSNRSTANKPLDVYSVERILKSIINDDLGIHVRASTHCLRKTFGYHVVMSAPDRYRAIQFLQTIFGHASPVITFAYIGITDDEIKSVYQNLNLCEDTMDFVASSGLRMVS